MIFSSIQEDYRQFGYPEAIVRALDFLKHTDLQAITYGRHDLEGDHGQSMYVNIDRAHTRLWVDTKPESHKQYIDIQFMIKGEEKIGSLIARPGVNPKESYPDRDLYFYDNEEVDQTSIHLQEGMYAIYFPSDWHRPLIAVHAPIEVKKAVVKVNVDLLK